MMLRRSQFNCLSTFPRRQYPSQPHLLVSFQLSITQKSTAIYSHRSSKFSLVDSSAFGDSLRNIDLRTIAGDLNMTRVPQSRTNKEFRDELLSSQFA